MRFAFMNLAAATVFAAASINAQAPDTTQPRPCSEPEHRQFDFWLGEWDLSWGEGETAGSGENVITRQLGDCVIEESFISHDEAPFVGRSVSVYNGRTGRWHQTWVDNQGGYLDFVGGMDGDRMVLTREATDDSVTFLQRMMWYDISADSLDWNWEKSTDGGESWETLWHIRYVRRQ